MPHPAPETPDNQEFPEETYSVCSDDDYSARLGSPTTLPNSPPSIPTFQNSSNFFGAMLLSEPGFKGDFGRRAPGGCKTARASSSSTGSSLFTIDSILAPRPSVSGGQAGRQQNSGVPTAVMHHPIHLGHIAAAASTFGTHSDFLGKHLLST